MKRVRTLTWSEEELSMKRILLLGICTFTLLLVAGQLARTQIKQEKPSPWQGTSKPNIVALHPNDSEVFDWDGGR
jgi:hypothetical protein